MNKASADPEIERLYHEVNFLKKSIDVNTSLINEERRSQDRLISMIQWKITVLCTIIAGALTLVSIVVGTSGYFQLSQIQDMKKDANDQIRALLGKSDSPNVELIGINGQSLSGQDIAGQLYNNPPKPADWDVQNPIQPYPPYSVDFHFVFKNTSNASASGIAIGYYWSDSAITGGNPSPDDSHYAKFSFQILDKENGLTFLPGNASVTNTATFKLLSIPRHARIPVNIRIYYGSGKSGSALIYLNFP